MNLSRAVGVATAVTAVVLTAACAGSAPDSGGAGGTGTGSGKGTIRMIGLADRAGVYKELVSRWNAAHPDQPAEYVEYSAGTSDQQRAQLVQNFSAKSTQFDLVVTNNVWVSEFAARGWIEELNPSDYGTSDLLPAPTATGKYQGKTYAVPFFTDAGLLYYRKDLVPNAPKTWDELVQDCAVAKKNAMGCYAGQFQQYDGLTVNVQEAIVDSGGSLVDAQGKAVVNTPQAKAGLQRLVTAFQDGVIPKEAITYAEEDGRKAFQQGRLLFLRNWPYVYTLASKPGDGNVVTGKFGVVPLPGNGDGKPGSSFLGGWDLSVNANSQHKDGARQLAAFLVGDAQQRLLLDKASVSPVRAALYDDPQLQKKYPYFSALKASLGAAVPAPPGTWSGISLAIQKGAYPALQGKISVDEALGQMQSGLERALGS